MTTKTKKIDTKKEAKELLYETLQKLLQQTQFEVLEGCDYDGFKALSLVVRGVNGHDVRLDLTCPKAGQDTYDEKLIDDSLKAEPEAIDVEVEITEVHLETSDEEVAVDSLFNQF